MVTFELLLVVLCMIMGAFFSGMETGIVGINRLRLYHLVRLGSVRARIIEAFLKHPERLLSTTLVGTNLCLVMVSTLSARFALRVGGEATRVAVGATMGVLILVFCEYLPKSWFYSRPIERCLPLARTFQLAARLLRPLSWCVAGVTQWISPKGGAGIPARTASVTREHLTHIARDSERGGHISALERLMIDRVLALQLRTARDLMVPLDNVVSVTRSDPIDYFFDKVRRHGFIRMPVRESADGPFVGLINLFYLIGRPEPTADSSVEQWMRPPLFIPDSVRADDILPILRRHRQPLALVRNTEGRVIGLVTTEDVLNAIAGHIPANASGERQRNPNVGERGLP